jgi:DNA polymerase III subunit epsilon
MVVSFPKDLLVIDLETTGTDPTLHSTIEIGAVLLNARDLTEIKSWSSGLIQRQETNETIYRSMALHGHSLAEISNGRDAREVIDEFFKEFGLDFIFAGWNIGFDVQFFRALLRYSGFNDRFDEIDYHRVDVWSLAQFLKSVGWFQNDVTSLTCLCEELGLPRSKAHSGLEDAKITAEALRRLVKIARVQVSSPALAF